MRTPSRCSSSTQTFCQISHQDQSFFTQESCNVADTKDGGSKSTSSTPASKLQEVPQTTSSKSKRHRVVPLSGNPYFTGIVVKSQVSDPFSLVIPRSFHQFLPQASVPVVFSCRNKTWKMRYSGQLALKRINTGWRQFAVDNNLKIGDGCVYELMDSENLRFRVQILRGEVPPPSAYEAAGRSSSNPVIIG